MKQKKYIKTNLIGFFIISIIAISGGIYAAITFPSNEVSYSNSSSDLKSNNVQGAIDELYKSCTTKALTSAEQIIENARLERDIFECRYFFTGANPNNYITFNGENAGWRIISVECDGTIKIMRHAGLSFPYWDKLGHYSGTKDWDRPASSNEYLNGTYYNGLSSTAKSQIVSKDWNIGETNTHSSSLAADVNNENSKKWNGKIALPTLSEYIRSNSDKTNCRTSNDYDNEYGTCKNTTWMYHSGRDWWTVTASADTPPEGAADNSVIYIMKQGRVLDQTSWTSNNCILRPSVYLSSKIKITGGTGTSTDPYQISL